MTRMLRRLLLTVLVLLSPAQFASAHARFLLTGTTPPRDNSTGLKTGPCGGLARTNTPVILTAGATLTLQWEEVIDHPGRFEFYFSQANDQNFQLLKTVPDTQDGGTLPHTYSDTLTVPNTICDTCTLQMIQVMTENPAAPTNYYSCADIQIKPAGQPPTPQPSPLPSPLPSPQPHPLPQPVPLPGALPIAQPPSAQPSPSNLLPNCNP